MSRDFICNNRGDVKIADSSSVLKGLSRKVYFFTRFKIHRRLVMGFFELEPKSLK